MRKILNGLGVILICALVLFCFFAASSCSNKQLSRNQAGSLIKSHESFKSTFDSKIIVGIFWYDWRDIKDVEYKPLIAKGILTFRETGREYAVWWKEYAVALTASGQQEAKNWVKTSEDIRPLFSFGPKSPNAAVFHIPIAQKELVDVTGIATDPGEKEATIEFTWKWVLTAQSKLLTKNLPSDKIRQGKAFAQLYDDGWRILRCQLEK